VPGAGASRPGEAVTAEVEEEKPDETIGAVPGDSVPGDSVPGGVVEPGDPESTP
jgi:hypothetical protein